MMPSGKPWQAQVSASRMAICGHVVLSICANASSCLRRPRRKLSSRACIHAGSGWAVSSGESAGTSRPAIRANAGRRHPPSLPIMSRRARPANNGCSRGNARISSERASGRTDRQRVGPALGEDLDGAAASGPERRHERQSLECMEVGARVEECLDCGNEFLVAGNTLGVLGAPRGDPTGPGAPKIMRNLSVSPQLKNGPRQRVKKRKVEIRSVWPHVGEGGGRPQPSRLPPRQREGTCRAPVRLGADGRRPMGARACHGEEPARAGRFRP